MVIFEIQFQVADDYVVSYDVMQGITNLLI